MNVVFCQAHNERKDMYFRNNLFHGAKDPQDNRDILVAKKGYKTLRGLVDIMLA